MTNQQILLAARPDGMISTDNFRLVETPIPDISDHQLLIKIHYVSLDPAMRGWMNAGTTYMPGVQIGAVMRGFAAGEVIESKHPDFTVGEYVTGLFGVQSYAISDGKGLTKVSLEDGPLTHHLGILGMPGMTAYFGFLQVGKPQAGDNVFVIGAAGIIGATIGQIAKIKGCTVVGTAGSPEKCAYLKEIGYDGAINYKTEDVGTSLKEMLPDGAHVVYDNVGGPLLDTGLANLGRGARVVICGAISQYNKSKVYGPSNYMKIVTARGSLSGIIVFDYLDQYPKAVKELAGWIKSGQLKVREQVENGIQNFPEVLKMLYTGDNFGKLLLKV